MTTRARAFYLLKNQIKSENQKLGIRLLLDFSKSVPSQGLELDGLLAGRRKKNNWLGPFWKSAIFVPPTPGSELKKQMQAKEEEMRAGGREGYPIKIIETAGRTLEQVLVNTDPFDGNKCTD